MRLTEDLVRKKSEHNDGVLEDLEEVSLHQLEIERLEGLGACKKLRILYLQNNIIPRIENLHHCKDLRYLNLALNNITLIEGLGSCEFLNKLDLTVNFVDVNEFEASMDHLRSLLHLRELYLMGNPATDWQGCRAYVAATLPQLAQLDGQDITRSERILAQQGWRGLRAELRHLAAARRTALGLPQPPPPPPPPTGEEDEEGNEPWCPETRTKMYREMAEQKAEVESKKSANAPKKRDFETEHAAAVRGARERERALGEGQLPRQSNEGRWEFTLEEEDGAGNCVLRLGLSRFLDSSLLDADIHPAYISIVVKTKLFRILWPEQVRSSEGVAARSAVTGELCITVPKVAPASGVAREARRREKEAAEAGRWGAARKGTAAAAAAVGEGRRAGTLAEELAAAAAAGGRGGQATASRAVRLEGIGGGGSGSSGSSSSSSSSEFVGGGSASGASLLRAVETIALAGGGGSGGSGSGGSGSSSSSSAQAGTEGAAVRAVAAAGGGEGPPPLEDVPIYSRAKPAPKALIQEHR